MMCFLIVAFFGYLLHVIENVHSICHLSLNFVIFVSSFRYRECCLLYVFVRIGSFRFHVLLLLLVYLATLQLAIDSVMVGLNTCFFFFMCRENTFRMCQR